MLCQVCGQNNFKYTCPACGIKSCCLDCIKRHKLEKGCSGVKPKTEFIPPEKMDLSMLIKDCAFIDHINSEIIRANDKMPPSKTKKLRWQKTLKKQCQERGITIHFMPLASTRSQENHSRYKNKKVVIWTCKFRFRSQNKKIEYERIVSDINENTLLIDLYNGICETTPNDYVANATLKNFTILLLAEGAEGGGHYSAEINDTVGANLFSKTIIEYPIFDVVPNECLSEWKIVTIFDVRNIEKPKEPIKTVEEKNLPSYDSIKEALKLDIINKILQKSQAEDELKTPLPPESK